MKKIRELLRLKLECTLSERQIVKTLGISRPSVRKYLKQFRESDLSYQEAISLSDDELKIRLTKNVLENRLDNLQSNFVYYSKELKRTGVNLTVLWGEYKEANPKGFAYTQFCHYYKLWLKASKISMPMEHKAGDKLFVDFTGKKLQITDRISGKKTDVEIFVATLGSSQKTYVEATPDQKKNSWINVNQNALHYFGGAPKAIVPDNLKSAVTKADKYEPDINPEYVDFAKHYGVSILPARAYKPKDKSLVEGSVKIIYSRIFAPLRDLTFYSIEDLNEFIFELLEAHNNKPMQALKVSRNQLFEEIERPQLRQLPIDKYQRRKFSRLKVHFNYHVYLKAELKHYSVPFRYIGKDVDIISSESTIEVYYNNLRIACHKRESTKRYVTETSHMPPQHQWVSSWTPKKFLKWAAGIGEDTKVFIRKILERGEHPEQNFKSVLGVLSLAKKYNSSRLNKACRRAVSFDNYSYQAIKNILKNNLEDHEEVQTVLPFPEHENIRGSKYYSEGGAS